MKNYNNQNIFSNIFYKNNNDGLYGNLSISGSKSISNRLLILKALYKKDIYIKNLSNCEDTIILKNSLSSNSDILNINHAGTAMRFLTSYFSIQENKVTILTGSERMKNRPILVLVESLKKIGAKIFYLEKQGYPPIKIFGKKILGGEIKVDARISSQYISSLMLIASKLKLGLKILLQKKITSIPYINMTFNLLKLSGIKIFWKNNFIYIQSGKKLGKKYFNIESDWSSASYYYSMATISKKSNIILSTYQNNSLQGDKEIVNLYQKNFGIATLFKKNKIFLKKIDNFRYKKFIKLNLNKTPDIAQTIAVTCTAMKIKCHLTGLETLKIKETDRLFALKKELLKFGAIIDITDSYLIIKDFSYKKNINPIKIQTYQDHRMAMAFVPLTLLDHHPILKIENPNVVNKSYPSFWEDLKKLGFKLI